MTQPAQQAQIVYTEEPLVLTANLQNDGTFLAVTPAPPSYGERWRVTRIVVRSNSTTAQRALVYFGTAADPLGLCSGTYDGQFDEADYPAGLVLPQGKKLSVIWDAGTAPAGGQLSASCIVQYDRLIDTVT